MSGDSVARYLKRRLAAAEYVRASRVPGHEVTAEMDWGKAFRSRPGSADWKAHCSCGWSSSEYQYGEMEALASAERHVRTAAKEPTWKPCVAPPCPEGPS